MTPTTEAEWIAALRIAATRGKAEFWSLVNSAQTTVVPLLPKAGETVLELIWPSGSGWRYSGSLEGALFIGEIAGVTISSVGAISITLVRDGSEVSLEVESNVGSGLALSVEAGVIGAVGVIPYQHAGTISLETDLKNVPWPAQMVASLAQGNVISAMCALYASAKAFWKATKLEIEDSYSQVQVAEGDVGSDAIATAGMGLGYEGGIGTKFTYGLDENIAEFTFSLGLASSLAAELSPAVRNELAKLQEKLGEHPIEPSPPALRSGNLLPGPCDSANSLNSASKLGIRARCHIPHDASKDKTYEIGFMVSQNTALALLGQSIAFGVETEVMYPLETFRQLVSDFLGGAPAILNRLTPISTKLNFSMKAQDITASGAFPGLDIGDIPGFADHLDAVTATLNIELEIDPSWVPGQTMGILGDLFTLVLIYWKGGYLIEAAREVMRAITKLSGDLPRLILELSLKELEIEVELTDDHYMDMQTPGFGEIVGVQGQGGIKCSSIYRFKFGPDAPELNPVAIAGMLVDALL